MTPEEILADDAGHVQAGGYTVRKGSVGAFIANARLLMAPGTGPAECARAEADLQALLPGLEALGLFEIFSVGPEPVLRLVERWRETRADTGKGAALGGPVS